MRSNYLKDRHVQGFINYLSKIIKGEISIDIAVGFSVNQLPSDFKQRFKGGEIEGAGTGAAYVLQVPSLESLFRMYWWNRSYFDDNEKVLNNIVASVRHAIENENAKNGSEIALGACEKVMAWGFGAGTPAFNSNMNWARNLGDDLAITLKMARNSLSGDSPNPSVFGIKTRGERNQPRMNSGWTKYYSLALSDFIIYDGRVGAALGFLAKRYLLSLEVKNKSEQVPESISFLWKSGRGSNHRNPSGDGYKFQQLYHNNSGMKKWAEINLKSSWILMEVIKSAKVDWLNGKNGLRKLEASLFMLGYDFSRI